ncbi:MAG: hypothetical protein LBJ76_04270 [Candidatus Accumulibacter sp.]|jgi:hypothetical protein|nr:hypothetical protein [Accumulibacter sp.]
MIPGNNLLKQAMRLIGHQTVVYRKNIGSAISDTGRDVPAYAPPVEIGSGSVQPVPTSRYAEMGLDLEKVYVTWYVPADVTGVSRGLSGDQIEWNGAVYQCQDDTSWYGQDGWRQVTCVRVGTP